MTTDEQLQRAYQNMLGLADTDADGDDVNVSIRDAASAAGLNAGDLMRWSESFAQWRLSESDVYDAELRSELAYVIAAATLTGIALERQRSAKTLAETIAAKDAKIADLRCDLRRLERRRGV